MHLFSTLPFALLLTLLPSLSATSVASNDTSVPPPGAESNSTAPVTPAKFLYSRDVLDLSVDICADLDLSIDILPPLLSIKIEACLCIHGVVDFVDQKCRGYTNDVKDRTRKRIYDSIKNSRGSRTCEFPPNCISTCQPSNPCHFQCKPGYVQSTDPITGKKICVCKPGTYSCNGTCKPLNQPCPSPRVGKRRVKTSGKAWCPRGYEVCGVYLGGGAEGWECLDTQRDLESCGGCTIPFLLNSPPGTDCTTIPGVSDVACIKGECRVRRCMTGYVVSERGDECVPVSRHLTFDDDRVGGPHAGHRHGVLVEVDGKVVDADI